MERSHAGEGVVGRGRGGVGCGYLQCAGDRAPGLARGIDGDIVGGMGFEGNGGSELVSGEGAGDDGVAIVGRGGCDGLAVADAAFDDFRRRDGGRHLDNGRRQLPDVGALDDGHRRSLAADDEKQQQDRQAADSGDSPSLLI